MLNMSSVKLQNTLPGFCTSLHWYARRTKTKNISTDLGITNGSQGFVRSIQTGNMPSGLTFCTWYWWISAQ